MKCSSALRTDSTINNHPVEEKNFIILSMHAITYTSKITQTNMNSFTIESKSLNNRSVCIAGVCFLIKRTGNNKHQCRTCKYGNAYIRARKPMVLSVAHKFVFSVKTIWYVFFCFFFFIFSFCVFLILKPVLNWFFRHCTSTSSAETKMLFQVVR